MLKIFLISLGLLFSVSTAQAQSLPTGKKQVYLMDAENREKLIGTVNFEGAGNAGDTRKVQVNLDAPVFTDHFLSMRPFRCIEDARQWACHLEYPYKLQKQISANDLTDLEYQLLFIGKKPGEFGINAWNGLYYKLALQGDGKLIGLLHEADFNVLSAPPEKEGTRPISTASLSPAGSAPRYIRLEIR